MSKVKYHQLSEIEKKEHLGEFYSMVALLKNREEVKNFFKDLLTLSETVMISRRIQVAKMLLNGRPYEEIRNKLKVGFTTINNVDKWLNYGFGGYRNIIQKFDKNKTIKRKKFIAEPFSLDELRKKYPAHFLLLNLLKGDK